MAQTRYVNTRFWKDNYIAGLNSSDKLLFLYFLTNQNTNIAGIYEITLKEVAMDTGIDKDMVELQLAKFHRDQKIYYVDGFIIVRNFTNYQQKSPKIAQGIAAIIHDLPDRLQTIVKLDNHGLWLNVGGDVDNYILLTSKINSTWLKTIQDEQKMFKQANLRRRQFHDIKKEFSG